VGKSRCSMVILMGKVGCRRGSVFLVVYKERSNLLWILETNEKKMKRNVREKGNQIDEERVLS